MKYFISLHMIFRWINKVKKELNCYNVYFFL